ncbi:MAG TPA: EAL domain-containing protein [Mycobacteriales bacterium]|nr:EAL domain-containing protein [Mycobacteriales bacterium]
MSESGDPSVTSALEDAQLALLAVGPDLDELGAAVVEHARGLTRCKWAAITERRSGRWVVSASTHSSDRPWQRILPPLPMPSRPLLVRDAQRGDDPFADLASALGARAFVLAPIHVWRGGPAMLAVVTDVPGALSEDDFTTTCALALTAATVARRTMDDAGSEQHRTSESLAWHQRTLESIALGAPLDDTLELLCREVEKRYEGAHCSVMLASEDRTSLRTVAGPTLPTALIEALDGLPIADGVGACGTAAFRKHPIVVEDIRTDLRTQAFIELGRQVGINAVWSLPLLDGNDEVLGTFALYREKAHRPDAEEVAGVASMGSLVALAVERHASQQALTNAAERDALTGLINRARFHRQLAQAISRCRAMHQPCAVLFLDLDGFKFVNDSLGHEIGDRLLVEVARRLERALPPGVVLGRFGGDEFTVLLEGATQRRIDDVADRVTTAFREPFEIEGGEFVLTTAIGIAVSGSGEQDPSELVRDADIAMYAAKEGGRGRRAMFDLVLRERSVRRLNLELDLRRAVRERATEVIYQPVVSLAERRWCGAEALSRWMHPERGVISPALFIPVAEETGMVGQLGAHVVATALSTSRRWTGSGGRLPVAVNVSPRQLADPGFVDEVLGLISHAGAHPQDLQLEVTESGVMDNPRLAERMLRELSDAGVQTVIDDFGTGFSSIARLQSLPVSGVKIDKTFVDRLGEGPAAVKVVAAVIDLAHALGLTTTAEGVEDAEQLHVLTDIGCDQAQGFLLATPLDADGVTETLSGDIPLVVAASF